MEPETKKKNNKKYIVQAIVILLIVISVIGITYALWDMFVVQKETNKLVGGCFEVEITDEDPISLSDATPISEADGRATRPYKVTIKNVCNVATKYQINAEIMNGTNIPLRSIRMAIDDKNAKLISAAVRITPTIEDATDAYRHMFATLGPGEEVTHNIRAWMDENAPLLEQGQDTFQFKISIIARTDEVAYNCDGCGVLRQSENSPTETSKFLFSPDSITRGKIESIEFVDHMNIPTELQSTAWDVSQAQNGSVMAWYTDLDNNGLYEVTIGSTGGVKANPYSANLFENIRKLKELNIEYLNTNNVTYMSKMFYYTGYNSIEFTLDVSNIDTSKVWDMSSMFYNCGYNNPNFTLDVSNFDTSMVTNMNSIFNGVGYNSVIFTLDLSNFDTSKVTDMTLMFGYVGFRNPNFTLDLSNFDTSMVTTMSKMFYYTGYTCTNFILDLSNFDTSKVKSMTSMFHSTGGNSSTFNLNLSSFNTSNVTTMSLMFSSTGYSSSNFTLDVSNFDTSKVKNMAYMFQSTGYSNPTFTLDLSNFDTSNVTDMSYMFNETAYSNSTFSLDLSAFNFGKIDTTTNGRYFKLLYGYRTANLLYVKDQAAKDFINNYAAPTLTNVQIKG